MYGLLRHFWQALKLAPKLHLFILFYYAAVLLCTFPHTPDSWPSFPPEDGECRLHFSVPLRLSSASPSLSVSRKGLESKTRRPSALVMSAAQAITPFSASNYVPWELRKAKNPPRALVYMVSLPLDVIDCFWLHRDVISHTEKTYNVLRSLPLLIPVLGSSLFSKKKTS
jgi:hypothetical protein